jgi:hypothetical protein
MRRLLVTERKKKYHPVRILGGKRMMQKAILFLSAAGALLALVLATASGPRAQEVPTPPAEEQMTVEENEAWDGECYTFWFMDQGGTLRGITTRSFTGPLRGSFFPEVHVIRRGPGPKIIPAPMARPPQPELDKLPEMATEPPAEEKTKDSAKPAAERPPLEEKPKP